MNKDTPNDLTTLEVGPQMWNRFFTVSPLVLIGTKEENGEWNLAPKHMATPLGFFGAYAFVCTPEHATYWNAKREGVFTVSYPLPTQIVMTSLAAGPRDAESSCKPSLQAIPVFPATAVDGVLLEDGYLFLECELDRMVDGFGDNSLIIGRIVAAHARQRALRQADLDDQDLVYETPLLGYLHPGRFSSIKASTAFPFHAGLGDHEPTEREPQPD